MTIERQTVLDPMIGTETTGIAALKLNRKLLVQIEIDFNTFEMVGTRIKNC